MMDLFSLAENNQALNATAAIVVFYIVSSSIAAILYKCGAFKDVDGLQSTPLRFGRMLAIVVAITLMLSGLGKVIGIPPMVEKFGEMGLSYMFKFTGVTEIFVGALIIVPSSYRLGLLSGIALLAGAITSHLPVHSDGIAWAIPSGSVMVLLWASAFFYTPDVYPMWFTRWVNKHILPKKLNAL